MATLHESLCTFISRWIRTKVSNVSGKFVEKIKINILYAINFFSENRAICENVEKYGRARQATI